MSSSSVGKGDFSNEIPFRGMQSGEPKGRKMGAKGVKEVIFKSFAPDGMTRLARFSKRVCDRKPFEDVRRVLLEATERGDEAESKLTRGRGDPERDGRSGESSRSGGREQTRLNRFLGGEES